MHSKIIYDSRSDLLKLPKLRYSEKASEYIKRFKKSEGKPKYEEDYNKVIFIRKYIKSVCVK